MKQWYALYVFLYSFFFIMHTDFIALKLMSNEVSLGSSMNFKNKKSYFCLFRAVETLWMRQYLKCLIWSKGPVNIWIECKDEK